MASDIDNSGREQCPLPRCGKILGEGHWHATPGEHSAHAYHTDKEGVARHWQHIDGLDVTPELSPYPNGTLGYDRQRDTDS